MKFTIPVTVAVNIRVLDEPEETFCSGEVDLSKGVCAERRENEVTERTADGDEDGIEDVTGERNPRVAHEVEEVGEVCEGRVYNIESRREVEQLVQGFESLNDGVVHRKEHENSEYCKNDGNTDVAADRSVKNDLMISCS